MKKSTRNIVLATLSGVLLGMLVFRNNWFPLSIYRNIIHSESTITSVEKRNSLYEYDFPYGVFYTKYSVGVPLFSDRRYCDTIGNINFENTYIIQQPRHSFRPIEIIVDSDIVIYRILSDSTKNSVFDDWDEVDFPIYVQGAAFIHNRVVQKKFKKCTYITLESAGGGRLPSAPILIKNLSDTDISTIRINGYEISDEFGLFNSKIKKTEH